ncbi:glycosyltransferase family 4 protein [Acinetobacter baumannii]
MYVVSASYTHSQSNPVSFEGDYKFEDFGDNFKFLWLKTPVYQKSTSKRRVLNWFEFGWKIKGLNKIIKDKPDVILYSSLSLVGFLGAERLAKKNKVPLIFEVRDIWPLSLIEIGGYSASHPFVRFLQWVEDRAYQKSDKVISNLKNAVDHMVSRGLDAQKFYWIPNGFSSKEVVTQEALPNNIEKQLPENKFIVGYTGSIGIANCLQNLIGAAIKLQDRSDIHFAIVGKGEYKEVLQQQVADHQLSNVTFIDPIPKTQSKVCLINLELVILV